MKKHTIKLKDAAAFNEMMARKGFTKSGLAKIVGVSHTTIVEVSNGVHSPGTTTAKKIVDALQVEWDTVFEIQTTSSGVGKEI